MRGPEIYHEERQDRVGGSVSRFFTTLEYKPNAYVCIEALVQYLRVILCFENPILLFFVSI